MEASELGSGAATPHGPPAPSAETRITVEQLSAPAATEGKSRALAHASPAGTRKRWIMGWTMIGAAGVVVVSLLLPWIAADPDATSEAVPPFLYGYEFDTARFAALMAIGLGIYGFQAVARERVRFHVWALIALITLLSACFFGVSGAEDSTVEKLGLEPQGSTLSDDPFANASVVDLRYGETIAAVASLVAIVPLAVLWSDARRRRLDEQAAAALRATGAAPPPPPPPPSGS